MSELVYTSTECASCVAKRAEIAKLKNERDVLRLCVVSALDLLKSMDVGYETQAVLRAVLERVTP